MGKSFSPAGMAVKGFFGYEAKVFGNPDGNPSGNGEWSKGKGGGAGPGVWTQVVTGFESDGATTFQAIAYDPVLALWLIVCTSTTPGTTPAFVLTSPDRATWTAHNLPANTTSFTEFNCISNGAGEFLVFGTDAAAHSGTYYSADGSTWTQATSVSGPFNQQTSPTILLAVSALDVLMWKNGQPPFSCYYSTDGGHTWLVGATASVPGAALQQAMYDGTQVIVAGTDGSGNAQCQAGTFADWSTVGTFTAFAPGAATDLVAACAFMGGRYTYADVADGGGFDGVSFNVVGAVTLSSTGTPVFILCPGTTRLVGALNGFTGVPPFSVSSLDNGQTWTNDTGPASPPANLGINGLAYGGGFFMGVDFAPNYVFQMQQ